MKLREVVMTCFSVCESSREITPEVMTHVPLGIDSFVAEDCARVSGKKRRRHIGAQYLRDLFNAIRHRNGIQSFLLGKAPFPPFIYFNPPELFVVPSNLPVHSA